MFEIYCHEFELNGEKYKLRPAPAEFISAIFTISGKLSGDSTENLTKDEYAALMTLVIETLKSSYPQEDPKKLSSFASQNFTKLIEPVMKVTTASPDIK